MSKPVQKKRPREDENQLAHELAQRATGSPAEPVDFAAQYKAHMSKLEKQN
jgi:hypothetical protein